MLESATNDPKHNQSQQKRHFSEYLSSQKAPQDYSHLTLPIADIVKQNWEKSRTLDWQFGL